MTVIDLKHEPELRRALDRDHECGDAVRIDRRSDARRLARGGGGRGRGQARREKGARR